MKVGRCSEAELGDGVGKACPMSIEGCAVTLAHSTTCGLHNPDAGHVGLQPLTEPRDWIGWAFATEERGKSMSISLLLGTGLRWRVGGAD